MSDEAEAAAPLAELFQLQTENLHDAYRERAHLVAALARLYPSSMEEADPSPGFRFVVYIDLPTGQASWHLADDDLSLFDGVGTGAGRTWDGHDTAEKYRRVDALAPAAAPLAAIVAEHERIVLEEIDNRDRAEEWADRLAYAIAPIEVIGEHSNLNNPWAEALDALEGLHNVVTLARAREAADSAVYANEAEQAKVVPGRRTETVLALKDEHDRLTAEQAAAVGALREALEVAG